MSTLEIEQLERSIKDNERLIELGNCLERLNASRDFIKVVIEGYFEKEAIRLVHAKADPDMQSEASQKSILAQMDSIGNFKQYLVTLAFKVNLAHKAKEADEEMRDELLSEIG